MVADPDRVAAGTATSCDVSVTWHGDQNVFVEDQHTFDLAWRRARLLIGAHGP